MTEISIASRGFYEAMQQYRHTPVSQPLAVTAAYKAVVEQVDVRVGSLVTSLNTAIEFYEFWATQTKSESERENFLSLAREARAAIRLVSIDE